MSDDVRAPKRAHGLVSAASIADRRKLGSDPLSIATRYLADAHLHPLFIVTPDDSVLLANTAAKRLCTDHDQLFQVRRQRLLIHTKPMSEWLDSPVTPGDSTAFLLRLPANDEPHPEFRVLVSRTNLRRARDPLAVTVYERHRPRSVDRELLQQLYDLTPSESATAAHLFYGLKPNEVARALGVSVHTVRSHTKRVFHKCHVKSQSELVRLLALGPGIE